MKKKKFIHKLTNNFFFLHKSMKKIFFLHKLMKKKKFFTKFVNEKFYEEITVGNSGRHPPYRITVTTVTQVVRAP